MFLTFNDLISIWRYIDFITNLKDSQREGVGELFRAENETVSRPSVHIDAGQSVHLGVHPVQTLVDHVCADGAGNTPQTYYRYFTGQYNCVLIIQVVIVHP